MEPSLIARREAARDRHDHAWELSTDGKGAAFEAELAAAVEELEAITVAAGAGTLDGDLDLAKCWRFLGDAWFDLGRVRGNPARVQALAAFERAQETLAGVSTRENAILMVGKANSNLGLAEGRDATLLRRAIALYEEALPTIRAEMPDEVPGVERSLGHARAILSAASAHARVERSHAQLDASRQRLESVEHEQGETVEDRQAQLAMNSAISTDAVVAQFGNAVANFIAASTRDGTADRTASDIADLNQRQEKLRSVAQTSPRAVESARQELGELTRMRELLAAELEAGRVSPVRRIQLEEILDEFEGVLMMKADDRLAAEARNGRIQRLMRRAMTLRPAGLDDRLADLHQAIKELAADPAQSPDDAEETQRLFAMSAGLGPELQASTSAGKPVLHEPRLRALAVDVQRHLRRRNLMIAEPLWDCGTSRKDPDGLFFAGAANIEGRLAASCNRRGIRLLGRPKGGDEGQYRWDQMRSAGAALFDLRGEPGAALAQTYYELGLAMSLGLPSALLCGENEPLPFDVEEPPIVLRDDDHDDERLVAAVDMAYGRPYRGEPDVSMSDTLAAAIRCVETDAAARSTARTSVPTARQAEATQDATLLAAALETMVRAIPGARPQLFFPSHPPRYPEPGARRLFHVMPFSQTWSPAAMQATEAACSGAGVSYVRGDRPDTARVLRSIWNEVGRATHVLADLTGFNPNVAFELGLAHARGKHTLMLVRGSDGKPGTFPDIAKLQIRPYRDDAELTALVARFVG